MSTAQNGSWDFEVFFDGDCPLCMREIAMLKRLDVLGRIRFTDIAEASFDPTALGVSWEALMRKIHGRLPNGELVEGVEVFRRLYAAVGFERLVGISRLPGISQALNVSYELFAKNRLRLTGRCDDACELPRRRLAS